MKTNIVAIDGGALIALQAEEALGEKLKGLLKSQWEGHCTEYAVLETLYVLCRKIGWEDAQKKIQALRSSHIVQIETIETFFENIAKIKCARSISIADCMTICLAKVLNGAAVFSHRELEIKKTLEYEPFDVEIIFLEEY